MKNNPTVFSLSIVIGLVLGAYFPTTRLRYIFSIFYVLFVNK